MNKPIRVILLAIGLALLIVGAVLMTMGHFEEVKVLPGVMIGVGAGLFGHSLGALIQERTLQRHPEEARRFRIEQTDERNVAIGNEAKSRAFDVMGYVYAALMLTLVLIGADFTVILLLVAAYLIPYGVMIYELSRLHKEM